MTALSSSPVARPVDAALTRPGAPRAIALAARLFCAPHLVVLAGAVIATSGHAQSSQTPSTIDQATGPRSAHAPAAGTQANVLADVAAGPLDQALSRFALQAGVPLSVNASQLKGRTTAGLSGAVTVDDGFRRLLAGSGYQATRTSAGYVLVAAPAAAQAPAAPIAPPPAAKPRPDASPQADGVLPVVTVASNRLGDITEASGSYTPGTIATATRLVLSPRETPQSISVITRQKMDDFNLTSIDQVMAHTPGISIVTYDSERTEYYARGFAVQNFQYDGIPMMRDSAYSAGNTLSDMVMYDRVEVLKGATGLLTGSGTPGATINLIRKKPTQDFRGHVNASIGSWGSHRAEVDVSSALNESGSIRARGVAAYGDSKTQLDHYSRRSTVLYGIVEADLTPATLLTVGFDYQDNTPKGSTWGGIPLLNTNGQFNAMPRSFNNGATWSHWDQYTRTGFATLEHEFDNGWVAKAQFNHQINGYDANLGAAAGGYPDPATGDGVSMWVGQYIGRTVSDAADVYATGPFTLAGRKHDLVLGGSVATRHWKNSGWWNLPAYDTHVRDYYHWQGRVPAPPWGPTPDYTDDQTTRERGLYATARWNLADNLKLITGGRWSSYRNKVAGLDEPGVVVPYVGTVVDLSKDYSLYASYSGIFTPQSLQDEQGRALDPLQGKNYEIGAKGALLNGRLNASVAAFQLVQDNFGIETGGKTPTGDPAYRAAQGVKTRGYELEVSGQVAPGWQLQAGFTHSVSRQNDTRVSTLSPANQFTLYASRQFTGALAGLTLGGGARWLDKTWGNIATPAGGTVVHEAKDYWVLDAMARYEFSKQLSASVNVSNLLDKKYYTIFSWYSTYTWGAPRAVTVNANYKF
ncbi:TonB-dependent siderophore receptor [Roseateles aquatilis]|uniref:TonB-dependent siderophore receptor n=1 Tax=Roseateles aquatilis TaxID=431061 RepID=A0A246JDU1_9BURK|nr:TonB-dependent receptor [Roseateles aquatilis]OWQ90803.1 TonB-dependent siderophore receptor [Roseateles aquatilis]